MNVNGARFHLLLGRADWGRCVDRDGIDGRSLESSWTSAPLTELVPAWDAQRHELTLQMRRVELPSTSGEAPLALDARRAATADRYGNIYRVGDDAHSVIVQAAAGAGESAFWPAAPNDCDEDRARERLTFGPVTPASAAITETYLALSVTADDYLVVAFARDAERGLLSFDLVAGGQPVETLWPREISFQPYDMCPRTGGGVWVLDRANMRLWELDCTLAVVRTGQPAASLDDGAEEDFQPAAGPARTRSVVSFPTGLDLRALAVPLLDPIAIESTGEGTVLLLDRDSAERRSQVVRLRRDGDSWVAASSGWLEKLPALAHDFAYAAAPQFGSGRSDVLLFISTTIGNQAHGFAIAAPDVAFALTPVFELFPLRRHAGRALLAVNGDARYDSGFAQMMWTSVVQQPRPSVVQSGELLTPVFDSGDMGTTWDRLLFDACIPADTSLEVWSRAGDDQSDIGVVGEWYEEPQPMLRSTGSELPWLRREAAAATRREVGLGTWELLLQRAQGRYLQLRLRLRSRNGTASPRIRAMRVWTPRFSYPKRFLPAVYREEPTQGEFLERWLANFEGTLTHIEDRIANLETLFDPRTAPPETLTWLAGWFDIALDPGWDERRHRLFIAHAMDFFRWRGTMHGLRLALELAFDPCFDARMFGGPRASDSGARRIRIVEAYQKRIIGALAAGDPGAADESGLRAIAVDASWTVEEGNAGLANRYAKRMNRSATVLEQITPFPLVAPENESLATEWRAVLAETIGFVPTAGATERQQWQRYLEGRYPNVQQLNASHASAYADFSDVPLPQDEPTATGAASDWRTFSLRPDPLRMHTRWQDFLARRYRRIERLQKAHRTSWREFHEVPIPDALPVTAAARTDWIQFERQLLPMHAAAHRFSVLLPVENVSADPFELEHRLALARRLVDLEKPAHTVFDVRYFWAFNRIGEARLELDTQLGAGSRACELIPRAVVGRAYLGASFVGGRKRLRGGDRMSVDC